MTLINPFYKEDAESITDPTELASLFEKPSFYDDITGPRNVIITGARGSGKSTILQYMKYDTQLLEKKSPENLDFIGIYWKCDRPGYSNLNSLDKIFLYKLHFGMAIFKEQLKIARKILSSEDGKQIDLVEKLKNILNNEIFENAHSLSDLENSLSISLRQLSLYASNKSLGQEKEYTGFYFELIDTLKEISGIILDSLPIKSSTKFFFLIDEFDNLDVEYQKVINTILKRREKGFFSLKIASRVNGIYTEYDTLDNKVEYPDDYEEQTTDFPRSGNDPDYRKLVINISNKRLRDYQYNLTIDQLLPSGNLDAELIKSVDKELFDEGLQRKSGDKKYAKWYVAEYRTARLYQKLKEKKGIRRDLSGFENFITISAGNIRQYLLLCSKAFHRAIEDGEEKSITEKGISPIIQNKIIYAISSQKYKEIEDTPEHPISVKNLIRELVEASTKKLYGKKNESEPESIKYRFVGDLSAELKVAIERGIYLGSLYALSSSDKAKRPQEPFVILNKIYCPSVDLSPSIRWKIDIKEEQITSTKFKKDSQTTLQKYVPDSPVRKTNPKIFNHNQLPANPDYRIFIGGNYEKNSGQIKDIVNYIKGMETDYKPIVVKDFKTEQKHRREICEIIVSHCSKAIFEVTNESGAFSEIEWCIRDKVDAYLVYSSEHISDMISSNKFFPVLKYSGSENLRRLINDIIQCMDGKIQKSVLQGRNYEN